MIKYIPIFKKGQIIENFSKLNLNEKILKAISDLNYESLTPIQEKAIPIARKGRDIIGISQSGTGKSCAFILPILESILKDQELGKNRVLRALIIAPTRELAKQIVKSIENYSKYMDIKTVSILGGESKNLQAKIIKWC